MNRLLQVLWFWKLVDIVEYWKLQCGREDIYMYVCGSSLQFAYRPSYILLNISCTSRLVYQISAKGVD
ncbi:hypothetical protein ES288_A03G044300v1 [Gossypium darwinii]|uniref:Uncharacterized protein n=2 Tax=Gossypium TaxID=3633 RepID=A0A5D2R3Y0_GOSTO|nr:hypothetical protein ES288_A03G044300v1 [Gossypium darwinii]TYI34968.1 hypothetical protein ES332_A03G044800v1 [Gossypium tomentosum]